MNLGTTVVGIIIIIIFTAPFILMSFNRKRKEKRQLQSLSEIAMKNNCAISRYELLHSSSIGIDDEACMIFHTRKHKGDETSQYLNLAEIQKCRVVNSSRTLNNNAGNSIVVDKLELGFSFTDKNRNEVFFEFYNTEHDSTTLTSEFQLLEKWCKIINDKITEMSKQKK